MSLKQKANDIVDEMDMELKIAEEELTKDFDEEEEEDAEFESETGEDEEEETDKQIHRTRHGKPTPYAPKNGRAPHLHHLYANYGGEVMPYINMFDLQLSYETSDIELLYHLCERINKMIDIINAENKYINRLTDWTEKKIHKLFKHQKKFENYLLDLLSEFEEEMNQQFNDFTEHVEEEIKEFEDLVNEELEAMNEEIERFESEMKDRADAFEQSMKDRADAFEELVNERLDAMDKEMSDFESEMKLRADNFENSINNEMSTFESEMLNRASEFETDITNQQSNFESEMNTRASEFESSMTSEMSSFKNEVNTEISSFETLVNSTINDFSSEWTTKLNDFETYINHHIEEFESAMDERADSFESDLKAEWNDFKEKFGDMYNEYITDITNQWNEFKEEMSSEWATEKENLENELASYEETLNSNYAEFKEQIESYIEECCTNVQNEINSFEDTVNQAIKDFEDDYNERLESTTKEEVDAKITDIVNESIYELIQNSEEFRNAISNVVNQLLLESETLKEMINDIVNEILAESETLNNAIRNYMDENFNSYLTEYLEGNETLLQIINNAISSYTETFLESEELKDKVEEIVNDMEIESESSLPSNIINLFDSNNKYYPFFTLDAAQYGLFGYPLDFIIDNSSDTYCTYTNMTQSIYINRYLTFSCLCSNQYISTYNYDSITHDILSHANYYYYFSYANNIVMIVPSEGSLYFMSFNNNDTINCNLANNFSYNNENVYIKDFYIYHTDNKIRFYILDDNNNILYNDYELENSITNDDLYYYLSLLMDDSKETECKLLYNDSIASNSIKIRGIIDDYTFYYNRDNEKVISCYHMNKYIGYFYIPCLTDNGNQSSYGYNILVNENGVTKNNDGLTIRYLSKYNAYNLGNFKNTLYTLLNDEKYFKVIIDPSFKFDSSNEYNSNCAIPLLMDATYTIYIGIYSHLCDILHCFDMNLYNCYCEIKILNDDADTPFIFNLGSLKNKFYLYLWYNTEGETYNYLEINCDSAINTVIELSTNITYLQNSNIYFMHELAISNTKTTYLINTTIEYTQILVIEPLILQTDIQLINDNIYLSNNDTSETTLTTSSSLSNHPFDRCILFNIYDDNYTILDRFKQYLLIIENND